MGVRRAQGVPQVFTYVYTILNAKVLLTSEPDSFPARSTASLGRRIRPIGSPRREERTGRARARQAIESPRCGKSAKETVIVMIMIIMIIMVMIIMAIMIIV